MSSPLGNLLHKIDNKVLNILTFPTHERYETNLCKTGFNFYAFRTWPGYRYLVKDWDTSYAPVPDNYILLDPDLELNQIPDWLNFDLILSQNKFGQYQIAAELAKSMQIPIISLEHTLPYNQWSQEQIEQTTSLRGTENVYISEYSMKEWSGSGKVIHHGIDTDTFVNLEQDRLNRPISVVNDFVNRDWCQPAGQKILTEQGYVPIEIIKIGDFVLTDSGRFNPVTQIFKRKYYGDMIVLTLDNKTKVKFTPDHNNKVYRDGQEKYIESNRLRIGDKLKFPKLNQTDFSLPEDNSSYDYAYLIGNIVADGHITKGGRIEISIEKEDYNRAELLRQYFEKYSGVKSYIREKDSVFSVECSSRIFGLWLREKIGTYSKTKSIPEFIINSSDKIKLSVLRGLFVCDGSFKNGEKNGSRFCYSTTSIKLASQVSSLLHNFGIKCSIIKEKRTTNKSNGKIVPIYRVQSFDLENYNKCKNLIENQIIEDNTYSYTIINYEVEEYNDFVYNCEVANNPSYVVYPGFVSHNCCGHKTWERLTSDIDKTIVGNTPGLSKPAQSVQHLVDLLNNHTIFLNTSTISPVPTSLLEAMACGCCPVSTATCMIPEIIINGVNGFISNDEEVLKQHLDRLMKNPEEAIEIGKKARDTIVENFGLQQFVQGWREMMLDVAQKPYLGL